MKRRKPQFAQIYEFFHLIFLLALLLGGIGVNVQAQPAANPFEITTRLPPDEQALLLESGANRLPKNPFDIVQPIPEQRSDLKLPENIVPRVMPLPPSNPVASKVILQDDTGYRRFLFGVVIVMMIFLTLIFTLFRNNIQKSWRSVWNANLLNQLYREQTLVTNIPNFVLYGFFFFNAGVFAMLLMKYYKIALAETPLATLMICIAGGVLFFLLRHLLLSFIAYVFPVAKEAKLFSFSLTVFNIVLGLFLVPMIWVVAYAPDAMVLWLLPLFLVGICVYYLFLYLRGLLVANRHVFLHKFHFLLYICTAEIAPIAIIIKLVISGGLV